MNNILEYYGNIVGILLVLNVKNGGSTMWDP